MGVTRQGRLGGRRKQPLEETPGVPGFLPFQLCKLQREPPGGAGWTHEVKFDGYRAQLRIARGEARLYSRNGLDWTHRAPEIAAVASVLPDAILDGELCAMREDGYSDFSGLQSALSSGRTEDLVLFVFDCLWADGEDLRPYALELRKDRLAAVLARAPRGSERFVGKHLRSVKALPLEDGPPSDLLAAACALGWEGIVSKRLSSRYRGDRAGAWVKAKCRPSLTVRIAGWNTENGAFKSLIAGVEEGGGLRYAGTIHTGYSAPKVRELLAKLEPLEAVRHPFTAGAVPRKTRDIHWVEPVLSAEIEMAEMTAAGKLRQASYKGLREDQ